MNFGKLSQIIRQTIKQSNGSQCSSISTACKLYKGNKDACCQKLGCKKPVCKKSSCKPRPPYIPPPPKCEDVAKPPNCIIGKLPCCPEARNPPDCSIPLPQPPCTIIPNPGPSYSEMIDALPPKPYTECDCWNPRINCT